MKKLLPLLLCIVLFCAACAPQTVENPEPIVLPSQEAENDTERSGPFPTSQEPEIPKTTQPYIVKDISYLIVDGCESGTLILTDGEEIFTLSGDYPDLRDGMSVQMTFGIIAETYPAQICGVEKIEPLETPMGGYFDLCGLYLDVLEDLWNKDEGLNGGASYISVDLSKAPGELSDGAKKAIAWIFANRHGAEALTYTIDELSEKGYLAPYGEPAISECFEDGLLFTITPFTRQFREYNTTVINFDACKWRSPLGAYMFSDCTAVWSQTGERSGYSIGSEMIS